MKKAAAGLVIAALIAVGGYIGFQKAMTGELFSGVEAAVEIGDKVPAFTLKDAEGNEHSLEKYLKEEKIIVLDFCTHQCPYSRGIDPQLVALSKEYKEKGVVVLGVDSNKNLTPEEIKEYQKESGKNYPVLVDSGNKYADAIGAKVTPEILVIAKDGSLKYHGAFDDRKSPGAEASVEYVKDAVNAVLADEEVKTAKVKAWGCGIKRK